MIPDITNAIILFGGGLALLLGLVQLLRPGWSVRRLMLFTIFASLTVIQLQEFIVSTTPGYSSEWGMMAFLIAKFILGPAIYLFYQSIFSKEHSFGTQTMFHLVPLALISPIIILVLVPAQYRTGILYLPAQYIIDNSILDHLHALGFALILGYIVALLSRMDILRTIRDTKKNRLTTIALSVIFILFIIISMISVSMITENHRFSRMALMLTSFFIIYWFILSQLHPDLFIPHTRKSKNRDRVDSLLQTVDRDHITAQITELLEQDRLYCDEDLNLKRLADMLSIHPKQLSAYLNHHLNLNFNTFINGYRVKEAIRMMREDEERSLLSIAFAVGFNSKSVFYKEFTKQTGMSPAKYRKSLEASQKS